MLQQLFPNRANEIFVAGTVDELVYHFNESERTEDFSIEFGGLTIASLSTDAKHDGQPAVRLTLTDTMGVREVGRVVLMSEPDGGYREELPEWKLYFVDDDDRDPFLAREQARRRRPKVQTVAMDMVYNEDTLEEAVANMAARWGVSIKVLNESGPGGGWPEVEYTGLSENLEQMLRGAYMLSDNEITEHLG